MNPRWVTKEHEKRAIRLFSLMRRFISRSLFFVPATHCYSSVFLHLFPEKPVTAATGDGISGDTGWNRCQKCPSWNTVKEKEFCAVFGVFGQFYR